MADTLEENYLLDENDAGSVIGSDDGAVSIQDEPEHSNDASNDQPPAARPSEQETKDEAARKEDKKRKRKEKEKARKQKVSVMPHCRLLQALDEKAFQCTVLTAHHCYRLCPTASGSFC